MITESLREIFEQSIRYDISNHRFQFYLASFTTIFLSVCFALLVGISFHRFNLGQTESALMCMLSGMSPACALIMMFFHCRNTVLPFLPKVGRFWLLHGNHTLVVLHVPDISDNINWLLSESFNANDYYVFHRSGGGRFVVIAFQSQLDAMVFKLTVK